MIPPPPPPEASLVPKTAFPPFPPTALNVPILEIEVFEARMIMPPAPPPVLSDATSVPPLVPSA
jgi:hypothetical protein